MAAVTWSRSANRSRPPSVARNATRRETPVATPSEQPESPLCRGPCSRDLYLTFRSQSRVALVSRGGWAAAARQDRRRGVWAIDVGQIRSRIGLAGQIQEHDVGVISQSIEHDPLAVGRDVEVLNHRAALQVEARELTLLAGLEIQAEKILIRSRALKSDECLSARHEAIRRP